MGILSAILGAVGLVGSIVTSAISAKRAKQTDEYNQQLNQTLMDREDNSWQRAVEDRSKAGLSIAGLSQGAGSGGTVSQLQSQQSTAFESLSNLLQNGSGTMFGLANSAYDRKLQKQIATDELELKKQQLKHEKLTSRLQYVMDLAQLRLSASKASDEHKIFEHNYAIAQGKENNPLARVYGSEPSEIERLIQALVNNRNAIKEKAEDFVYGESVPQPTENNILNSASSAGKKTGKIILTTNELKKHIGQDGQKLWEDGELNSNTIPVKVEKDGNNHYLITETNKRQHKIRISTSDYNFWVKQLQ